MKTALLLALALGAPVANAQDLDEDSSRRNRSDVKSEVVREIVRGLYIKAGAGSQQFLLARSAVTGGPLLRPVVAMNLGVGQDIVDRERMSLAWELDLMQALHNGPKLEDLEAGEAIVVQGDIHTFSGVAFLELSGYLTRRFGIGLRAGGGVTMAPVLMEQQAYTDEVVNGLWGGQQGSAHAGPLPTFGGGPTIEYYTKLSHFSVGADVDVLYVLGIDLALAPSGYLKYTF